VRTAEHGPPCTESGAGEGTHGGEVAPVVLLVQVPERGLVRLLLVDLL
jgi:hypothetical protein